MTSNIDADTDKVLSTYTQYYDILMMRHANSSIDRDVAGLAASLTQAHYADHIVCKLKDIEKILNIQLPI